MMKKVMIRSILVLSLLVLTSPAWAATCGDVLTYDYDGYYYAIDGNLKLTVTFTNYVTATITLPKLANFGDFEGFYFYYDDSSVSDDLLYGMGIEAIAYWEQSGCNLYMDFGDLADQLVNMVAEYGADYGLEAEIVGSTSVTAKISSKDDTNSGKISIKINLYSDYVDGSISISLTFKGYPTEAADKKVSLQRGKASMKPAKPSFKPEIKNFLASVFSKLPKKGAVPQLIPSH